MESRFEKFLKQRIAQEVDKNLDFLAQSGAKDYAEYRHYCGRLEALREIVIIMNEVNKDLTGD